MRVLRSHHEIIRHSCRHRRMRIRGILQTRRHRCPAIGIVPPEHFHTVTQHTGRPNLAASRPRQRHRRAVLLHNLRLARQTRIRVRIGRPIELDVRIRRLLQLQIRAPRRLAAAAARHARVQAGVLVLAQIVQRQRSRFRTNLNAWRRPQHRNPIPIPRDHRRRLSDRFARQHRHRFQRQRLIHGPRQDDWRRPLLLRIDGEHNTRADAADAVHGAAHDYRAEVGALHACNGQHAAALGRLRDVDVAVAGAGKHERSIALDGPEERRPRRAGGVAFEDGLAAEFGDLALGANGEFGRSCRWRKGFSGGEVD